ncbi:hypothetical protein K435DRAFT_752418 [Dendrothele bispora CBS 962.96]|uniref:O-methyltransferase C-terminal domain-containing protein n=1 Tax=Dendrothele bispora (strain CBS 962.96) TaxID=1314807 RepID=A0A4S8MAN7_DENBC|nr:hypothetical protein K435DRAFT_752418 [Dendrothele bispora CBS 962.96]
MTPPSPSNSPDFPSLDAPYDPSSISEALTSHPIVMSAINRIVAATGQMSLAVQRPFMSLCDASMGYHLPSCLRLLEASHTVELLREAGPGGLHVKAIAAKTGVDQSKLAHILRLLASHHICREVSPNVFANNRLSSLIDSGKPFELVRNSPETKYEGTNGIAAFVGLCTDELFKSSAYLTDAYFLSSQSHKNGREPTHAPFNHAFGCQGITFFGWLEGEGIESNCVNGPRKKDGSPSGIPQVSKSTQPGPSSAKKDGDNGGSPKAPANLNRFRLERFGKAMMGTESWEIPGAILSGFPWHSLPKGSTIVDVGGGIGSTSMLLAHTFSSSDGSNEEDNLDFKFVIQDRDVVCDLGEKAWKAQCPHLLESGIARFQKHDFFTPQPIKNAAVYLLRVVLHDWPNAYAQRVLQRLREAASPDTKLLIADFVLPLACADDLVSTDVDGDGLEDVQGAEKMLAPAPLLPNLGKASANVYWMDLTMQVTFNGQERTLREIVVLARSAGWKVTKVTKAPGSLFGHIIAVPAEMPIQKRAMAGGDSALLKVPAVRTSIPRYTGGAETEENNDDDDHLDPKEIQRPSSRCATPAFGAEAHLPSYEEARSRFGGGPVRGLRHKQMILKPPIPIPNMTMPMKKKARPSPLAIIPPSSSSTSPAPRTPKSNVLASPRQPTTPGLVGSTAGAAAGPAGDLPSTPPIKRRVSYALLSSGYSSRSGSQASATGEALQTPSGGGGSSWATPSSPTTPRTRPFSLNRQSSLGNLQPQQLNRSQTYLSNVPPLPPAFSTTVQKGQKKQSQSLEVASFKLPVLPDPSTPTNLLSNGLRSPISPSSPLLSSPGTPTPTRLPKLSRHQSYTLLPSVISRERSGSIAANLNALPVSLGGRANTLLRTLELSGGRSSPSRAAGSGTPLEFGQELPQVHHSGVKGSGEQQSASGVLSLGSVLASAAKIEKGLSQKDRSGQSTPTHS